MKRSLLTLVLVLFYLLSFGQDSFYSKAYGSVQNPPVIFLHGGPGYNSVSFEVSTAQALADNGFYVIVYDQRGCGRTKTESVPEYNFSEAFTDLNNVYETYHINSATLIGHSFGGTIGVLFSSTNPEKVRTLILVSSPLSYPMMYKNIIARSKKIYEETHSDQLKYIALLEKMDSTSLEYSTYSFMHAMANGFYSVKKPTQKSIAIKDNLKKDPRAPYLSFMTQDPVRGFYKTEKYTTLNLSDTLASLKSKVKVFGIYGQEDGLFSSDQIALLSKIIGRKNFSFIKGASHSVFIDQQDTFITLVKKYGN